jgi:hypothetical protein
VVVELKAGLAKDAALGQLLGYMGAIKRETAGEGERAGRPVRGILVAKDFDERVRHASLAVPNVRLMSYQIRFTFDDRGFAWILAVGSNAQTQSPLRKRAKIAWQAEPPDACRTVRG